MHVPSIVGAVGVIVLAAALGCGPKPVLVSHTDAFTDSPCSILPATAAAPDTIRVALFDGVDWSHAPVARNDAERLVFSHLFDETMALECREAGVPAYHVARATERVIVLVPSDSKRVSIKFIDCRGRDPRDLIDDASVDVMFVTDVSIAQYASRRDDFAVRTLPVANKSYVLLSMSRANALAFGQETPLLPSSLANELASQAVRDAHAVVVGPEAWWNQLQECDSSLVKMPGGVDGSHDHIVYDVGDPVARDLAERIVSLASSGTSAAISLAKSVPGIGAQPRTLTALGVSTNDLWSRAASGGADLGYIVALQAEVMDPCVSGFELTQSFAWLGGRPVLSKSLLPLVSTHAIAIVRNTPPATTGSGIGLTCDRFGSVRVYGWSGPGSAP